MFHDSTPLLGAEPPRHSIDGLSQLVRTRNCWWTPKSRDPTMASLQSLIECFLMENDVHPDLRDVTEEDVGMWVKKSADLDVSVRPLHCDVD